MNELELLRAAAQTMRERASAGNPNPWARPTMAEAIADWLDAEADVHERCAAADVAVRAVTGNEFRVGTVESTLPHAVAVARVYLGVES